MTNLATCDITSAVRAILRADEERSTSITHPAMRLGYMREALRSLEQELPSRDPAAFETANLDAFGYATVLSYLSDTDPLSLQDLDDPVRDTITIGRQATALCLSRGLKIVRVPACTHVTQRYAKITHVNAYPIGVLAEVIGRDTIASLPAQGVRVKPLVFSEFSEGGCMGRPHPFQYFITQAHNGRFLCHHDETWHDTLPEAQAHAQADYQRAALEPAEAGGVEPCADYPNCPPNHPHHRR